MIDRGSMQLVGKWSLAVFLAGLAITLGLVATDDPWATGKRRVNPDDDRVIQARQSAEDYRRSAASATRLHETSPGYNPFADGLSRAVDWKQAARSAEEMAKVLDLLANQVERGHSPR